MALFEKILVPTDFSQHAEAALRLATELAKSSDAALCVVHVYDLIPYTLPEGIPVYNDATLSQLREDLSKRLSLVRGQLLEAGVRRVETKLLEGQPYSEIVRAAKDWGAQLIVMGTHGRSGVAHLFLGSVAERVVRKAPCPVMTVPVAERATGTKEKS